MGRRDLFKKVPVIKRKGEPLPKDEPLSPYEAMNRFVSNAPKGLAPSEASRCLSRDENHISVLSWLPYLVYTNALFELNPPFIKNTWFCTLKDADEMERTAKEILEDDELVRLFVLRSRTHKGDYWLQHMLFVLVFLCVLVFFLVVV